jgi:hypothetical protein
MDHMNVDQIYTETDEADGQTVIQCDLCHTRKVCITFLLLERYRHHMLTL